MPKHDVQCSLCGKIIKDRFESPWPDKLLHEDGGELEILWQASSPRSAAVHPSERAVIWRDPLTGRVAYPPRNDVDMPQRYQAQGYVREEMETLKSLEKFEKAEGVLNEKLWFNSGNELKSPLD